MAALPRKQRRVRIGVRGIGDIGSLRISDTFGVLRGVAF
jgi:hypothetical protein